MLPASAREHSPDVFVNCAPAPESDDDVDAALSARDLRGSSMTASSASEASPTLSLPPGDAPLYFNSPRPSSSADEGKDLRLFVSAAGLRDSTGGRVRAACAVVYLRTAGEQRAHLSNVTASSADAPPPPARAHETRTLVGQTEVAQVVGRAVEFARTFRIPREARARVHVDIFAVDARDKRKTGLAGVGEISLARVVGRRGARAEGVLACPPAADADARERRRKADAGVLWLAVEDVSGGLEDFHLDVQCEQMKRARRLAQGRVRRAHYAVHTLAGGEAAGGDWSLLFRSQTVEMVRKKKDGGSMEYNYFSRRPVFAAPGVIVTEDRERAGSPIGKAVRKVMTRNEGLFFSLPSCQLALVSPHAKLRLCVYDDSGSAPEVLAETEFSFAQLREMSLGDGTEVKGKKNAIGQAALKFVEVGKEPRYFCLSIMMPNGK